MLSTPSVSPDINYPLRRALVSFLVYAIFYQLACELFVLFWNEAMVGGILKKIATAVVETETTQDLVGFESKQTGRAALTLEKIDIYQSYLIVLVFICVYTPYAGYGVEYVLSLARYMVSGKF